MKKVFVVLLIFLFLPFICIANEYVIELSANGFINYIGLLNFKGNTNNIFDAGILNIITGPAKKYCENLGLKNVEVVAFLEFKNPSGPYRMITLCISSVATEKYGYLCDYLNMLYDRVEDNKIICKDKL